MASRIVRMCGGLLLGIGWMLGCHTPSPPHQEPVTLRIAAASDLKFALEEILDDFRRSYPEIEVQTTLGSSGSLFAQLTHGAPFDMFLSADSDYPNKLVETGNAIRETEFRYARGYVVLWVKRESPLDLEAGGIRVLEDSRVRKIALANPMHAPYGRAARAALQHYGLFESLEPKLVFGENVAQAAQFVDTSAADAGLIALSVALSPTLRDRGRYWVVPDDAYPQLVQSGVVMTTSTHRQECRWLREHLVGETGQRILARYGYSPVESP